MQTPNPYQSALDESTPAKSADDNELIVVSELSEDAKQNIVFTSRIVKFACVFAAAASLAPILQAWVTFRFYGVSDGWTSVHTLVCVRLMYSPCWLFLAWMSWKYGRTLDAYRMNGIRHTELALEQQAKLWVAIGLLICVVIIALVFTFRNALDAEI